MTDDNERMATSRNLEMGLAQMEQLKGQIESLRSQIASLQSILMDYTNSLDVIKEIDGKSGKEILMPIGGSAFLKVKVMEDGICLVDRGAGVFMDTDLDKAKRADQGKDRVIEKWDIKPRIDPATDLEQLRRDIKKDPGVIFSADGKWDRSGSDFLMIIGGSLNV